MQMLFQLFQPGLRRVEKVDQPNKPTENIFPQDNTKNP